MISDGHKAPREARWQGPEAEPGAWGLLFVGCLLRTSGRCGGRVVWPRPCRGEAQRGREGELCAAIASRDGILWPVEGLLREEGNGRMRGWRSLRRG